MHVGAVATFDSAKRYIFTVLVRVAYLKLTHVGTVFDLEARVLHANGVHVNFTSVQKNQCENSM